MELSKLLLKNFRNHEKLDIEPNGKSILIKGPNGKGKTNILEAINLLSTTKSFRAKYDREMVKLDDKVAYVGGVINKDDDSINLEVIIQKGAENTNTSSKKLRVDKTPKKSSHFIGILNTVLFAPNDLELVTGSPSLRRNYIDNIFIQTDANYTNIRSKYTKVVRNRNKILEKINKEGKGRDELPYWNSELLKMSTYIQNERTKLINEINNRIVEYTKKLTENNLNLEVEYVSKEVTEAKIKEYMYREIASKRTLMGPHRDTIDFKINGNNLGSYGSRGQQRTCVLALKLCELDYITEKNKVRPLLLLDDIFSELDPEHRRAVENIIGLQQTIITSADTESKELDIEYLN